MFLFHSTWNAWECSLISAEILLVITRKKYYSDCHFSWIQSRYIIARIIPHFQMNRIELHLISFWSVFTCLQKASVALLMTDKTKLIFSAPLPRYYRMIKSIGIHSCVNIGDFSYTKRWQTVISMKAVWSSLVSLFSDNETTRQLQRPLEQ